jgi:hypothetical protein
MATVPVACQGNGAELTQLPIVNLPAKEPAGLPNAAAGCQSTGLPEDKAQQQRLPKWLKRQLPKGNANHFTAG